MCALLATLLVLVLLDLELSWDRRLFTALIVLIDGIQHASCSSSASGTSTKPGHRGAHAAHGRIGAARGGLTGCRSRRRSLLLCLQLEQALGLRGRGVEEKDGSTGGLQRRQCKLLIKKNGAVKGWGEALTFFTG